MKIVEFNVMDRNVKFTCESRGTQNGFAHDARLFIDGDYWGTAHAYYLNRTWEYWVFQSACLACCNDRIEERKECLKDAYKARNGISKVYGDRRKDELQKEFDSDYELKLLGEIKNVLKDKSF